MRAFRGAAAQPSTLSVVCAWLVLLSDVRHILPCVAAAITQCHIVATHGMASHCMARLTPVDHYGALLRDTSRRRAAQLCDARSYHGLIGHARVMMIRNTVLCTHVTSVSVLVRCQATPPRAHKHLLRIDRRWWPLR